MSTNFTRQDSLCLTEPTNPRTEPMTRTVNLQLTNEDIIEIANVLADDDRAHAYDKLWAAIGYLSSWNPSYPSATIYRDGDTDLVAAYKKEDGSNGYVIGAVWHGTHYGFHS